MRFDERFEVIAGSVSGRSHAVIGKSNQDAYAGRIDSMGLCSVVCDGCGSGARSEVGAALGARIISEKVLAKIALGESLRDEKTWERIRSETLEVFGALVQNMGEPIARVVAEHFLFTVMGIAVSNEGAVVFGIGDGLFALNEEITRIGPFPGNAPPYLGYGLLGEGPAFTIHRTMALDEFESALIGTDGMVDYLDVVGKSIPGGRRELVKPLSSFWREDKYFSNADALRRTLWLVNREVQRPVWNEKRIVKEAGLLEDDTTLVVVRKRSEY